MSITRSFNGKSIKKPGAYSKNKVDNSSGAPLRASDTIFIVGESTKGAPGSAEGVVEFSAERLDSLIEKYGRGPLVDCANAAVKPSKQAGIGGASKILIYKTNATTQASTSLQNTTPADVVSIKDRAYGVDGNLLTLITAAGSGPNKYAFSVAKLSDTTESLGENAAESIITVQYTGDATAASLVIAAGVNRSALTLAVTISGQTDGSASIPALILKNYTMKTLVDYINMQTGYVATLVTASKAQKKANELDAKTVDLKAGNASLTRVHVEIQELLDTSARITASLVDPVKAFSVAIGTGSRPLSGGAQGASTNSNFSTGMAQSLANEYDVILSAVSRDASTDIADTVQGFTDSSSTYTIAAILAAQETHLRLRGDTKNRKEAQAFAGIRAITKAACFAQASTMASELQQLVMEDCLISDVDGNLTYKHPHVLAALAAGMRLGQPVGEPLTHKYPNVNQVGHFINPETGLVTGDFNPGLDADAAIDAGILFLEKVKGGYRWVVDNTTYGADDSFIYNRGSVMQAAINVNKTLRETAELVFVGKKVSNGLAVSIKNVVRNKLRELNAPDVNITTASEGAPEGFEEATFVVTIVGNTARVQVKFIPVQGLDFVFFDFTLGDIKQSA